MRHRRICHCDASFRPQLGRARISPSGRGGPSALLNRLRAATTSRWRAQFATRLASTVFRFSTGATDLFLNRNLAGPAFIRKQAMQLTSRCALFPRSSSLGLTRNHCVRTPTRPTRWGNDSPPASSSWLTWISANGVQDDASTPPSVVVRPLAWVPRLSDCARSVVCRKRRSPLMAVALPITSGSNSSTRSRVSWMLGAVKGKDRRQLSSRTAHRHEHRAPT